jgi:uncharacterized OsmC-like protein
VQFSDLSAETVGEVEVEVEGKVLVIKRIKQTFRLSGHKGDRETVERVLGVYAESCPVARSVKGSIEISSELKFTPA